MFKLWLVTSDSYLACKSTKYFTSLSTKQEANLNFLHFHKEVLKSCCYKMTAHQASRPPKGVGGKHVALYSPSALLYTTQIRKNLQVYIMSARCVHTACSPEPQLPLPNRLIVIPKQKFLSCHREQGSQMSKPFKSIISAYLERVLMRILPAKTELRKQHYCQIVPLEVLTGKSYQSKI